MSEKTLHAVLKMYYEPDEDNHEVAIDGYFADIYNEPEEETDIADTEQEDEEE